MQREHYWDASGLSFVLQDYLKSPHRNQVTFNWTLSKNRKIKGLCEVKMVHQSSMAKKSAAVKPVAQKVPELQILGRWKKTPWEIISTCAIGCCQRQDRQLVEPLLTFSMVVLTCLSSNAHGIKCGIICSCAKLHSGFGYTYTPYHRNKQGNFSAAIINTALVFFSSTRTTCISFCISHNTKPHNERVMLKSSTV